MAVIKSGDSADQLHVTPAGAAKVVFADGTTVALDAASLAALEDITAAVTGTVTVSGAVEVTNDTGSPLPISGTVIANVGTGTQPVSGTVSVGNFPGTQQVTLDTASLAALETISVANFPATQPISGSVTITDGSGPVTVDGSVSVTNFPTTQAVSGTITVANPSPAGLTNTELRATPVPITGTVGTESSTLSVTATAATGAAVTATLPAAAGQYHHISYLEIILYSTAARAGAAAPIVATTTNLPGNPAHTFPTAGAIGTAHTHQVSPARPLRSATPGVATAIVCPAVVGGLWRINVHYSTGA